MPRTGTAILTAALLALSAACGDNATIPQLQNDDLKRSFNPAFVGTGASVSSFSARRDSAGGRTPGEDGGKCHDNGPTGLCDSLDFMGGGLLGDYLGSANGANLFVNTAPPSGACSYSAASGTIGCDSTFNGVRIARTLAYRTAAGTGQPAYDSATTHSLFARVTVSGTITRRDTLGGTGGTTTEVRLTSERSVAGIGRGSTQRTVDGASAGTESTSGTSDRGAFTAMRTVGDTTRGLVIPLRQGQATFPTAGTVIRAMQVTLTYSGEPPASSTRREVITYDGSSTAKLVVTQDGTTWSCTIGLPHGRPLCSSPARP